MLGRVASGRVVGTIAGDFPVAPNESNESLMRYAVADGLLAATSGPGTGDADLALVNSGGVRASLAFAAAEGETAPGQVTWANKARSTESLPIAIAGGLF